MFCRNCGAEIPEGGSFCGSCGTPVKEEPVAVREPEGSRPVMEDREKEKKTEASSGARENNPDMEMQSKGGKPLIIEVCSGALLLAVGIAILFTTGVPGGKDKPKEAIAEVEEPETVADSEEQKKEEMEEKPVGEEPDEEEPMQEEAIEEELDVEEPEQDVNEAKEDTADLGIEDYLCSDSSTRILTQEDVEKLLSGTYDNLPEGKGIIQMAVNEMYARKGYQFGSQSIQNYFETKGWYREIERRSDDQESIYQNMSDIEQANVQFLSSFADDEKINTTYDTDCFCIAKFELADGLLTVVDDGAPGVGWGNRNTFSFSLPISGDCQWQKAYYGVDGLVVMDEPYSYEEAVRDIAQWRENYNAALEGEEAALDSPVGLHIEVVDSVVVRVYTTWS